MSNYCMALAVWEQDHFQVKGFYHHHPVRPQRHHWAGLLLLLSLFSFLFPLFFSVIPFLHSLSTLSRSSLPLLAPAEALPCVGGEGCVPHSHITQVEVRLLYPPVGRDLLRLVALHVLLHGGETGAVFRADGALVG